MLRGKWHVVATVFGASVIAVVLTWALTLSHCKAVDCRVGSEQQLESQRSISAVERADSTTDWAQVAIGLIGLVGIGATALYARRALSAELEPLLTIDLEIPKDFEAINGKLPSLYFQICNEGRSAAIVTGIFRSWHVLPHGQLPPPILPPKTLSDWSKKQVSIPIGGGRSSDSLRTLSEKTALNVTSSDWIVFQGYIESRSLSGDEFQDGFCVLYSFKHPAMRRHLLLLDEDREQYNYHRRKPN